MDGAAVIDFFTRERAVPFAAACRQYVSALRDAQRFFRRYPEGLTMESQPSFAPTRDTMIRAHEVYNVSCKAMGKPVHEGLARRFHALSYRFDLAVAEDAYRDYGGVPRELLQHLRLVHGQ